MIGLWKGLWSFCGFVVVARKVPYVVVVCCARRQKVLFLWQELYLFVVWIYFWMSVIA